LIVATTKQGWVQRGRGRGREGERERGREGERERGREGERERGREGKRDAGSMAAGLTFHL
jgi:hypothetical protein